MAAERAEKEGVHMEANLTAEQVRVLKETAKETQVVHGEVWIGAVIKDSVIQEVKVQPSHRILVRNGNRCSGIGLREGQNRRDPAVYLGKDIG